MRELIEPIVRALVDAPEDVQVRLLPIASNLTILEITVAEDDLGKVIGKGGQIVQALRVLLTAAAGRARTGRWQLELCGEVHGNHKEVNDARTK